MKRFLITCLIVMMTAAVHGATNTVSYSDLNFVKTITFNFSNLNIANHVPSAPSNALICQTTSKMLAGSIDRVAVRSSTTTGATFRIIMTDENGTDMLGGFGSVISATAGTSIPVSWYTTNRPFIFESKITCSITNFAAATSTNAVSLQLYYRE